MCFGLPKTYFSPHQREAKNHPDGLIIDRIFMDDNTTNKGGRPKKKLSEKRSYSVLLKLNTKEYFTLKSKANEAGLNKSEYLRTLIYESQVKARITPEQMNEIRQLTGIANNINQIACRLNTYGISAAPTELKLLRICVDKHLKDLKS